MPYTERLIFIPILLLIFSACQGERGHDGQDYYIEWDETSLVRIAKEGGYPRLRRLDDGSFLPLW